MLACLPANRRNEEAEEEESLLDAYEVLTPEEVEFLTELREDQPGSHFHEVRPSTYTGAHFHVWAYVRCLHECREAFVDNVANASPYPCIACRAQVMAAAAKVYSVDQNLDSFVETLRLVVTQAVESLNEAQRVGDDVDGRHELDDDDDDDEVDDEVALAAEEAKDVGGRW